MSGFHAIFSIGGFAGSALMTALLSLQLGTLTSSLIASSSRRNSGRTVSDLKDSVPHTRYNMMLNFSAKAARINTILQH